ncbi:ABC transporter substrate-binding protein [Gordonia sp. NPDC058843]|uniref:ABC transporter substrate-binding protein n=1 Tax=Gordonia sp. NPDC058843 TaxID=3346648 RepID=UPI003681EB7E
MNRSRPQSIRRRRGRTAVAATALLVGSLTACTVDSAASDDGVVDVGILSEYTGPLSLYGPAWESGFRAGLEELTGGTYEVDGTKIDIEVKDSAGDPATGQTAVRELLGNGTDIIVGTASSSVAVSVAQTAVENDVVFIAGAASTPALNAMSPGVFRTSVDVRTVNNAVLEMIKQNGGKRVAYVGQDYDYGQTQADAMASQAGEYGLTVEKFLFPTNTHDFTAGVAKVLASGVDTIYVGWTGEGLAQLFQALVAQNAFADDSPVTVTSLAPLPQEYATVANAVGDKALANFALVSVYAEDTTGTPAEKVVAEYVATEAEDTEIGAQQAYGYLGALALVRAIQEAGPGLAPADVHKALAGAKFDGVQGPVAIRAEDHLVESPMFEYRLVNKDGALRLDVVREIAFEQIAPPVDKALS